ncbi:MAG: PEP-CTERM sorting domain-containing protein [Tsuneonella sp.]
MRVVPFLALLLTASPALAAGSAVPEPSAAGLFILGVAGVVIGRQGARRKDRD